MRTCRICGKELKKYQKTYCSKTCCGKGKLRQTVKCGICGKSFESTCISRNRFVVKKYGVDNVCPDCKNPLANTYYEMRCSKCGRIYEMPRGTFTTMLFRSKKAGKETTHLCRECRHTPTKKSLVLLKESEAIIAQLFPVSIVPEKPLEKLPLPKKPLPKHVWDYKECPREAWIVPSEFGKSLKIVVPECEVIECKDL